MKKVLVFGSDINALLAVHAAATQGFDVSFMSNADGADDMSGRHVLAAPIPLISTAAAEASVRFTGDPETFAGKLSGSRREIVFPEQVLDGRLVWDAYETYRQLWETYGGYIVDRDGMTIDHALLTPLLETGEVIVINALPKRQLCADEDHGFVGHVLNYRHFGTEDENSITFNGTLDEPWLIKSAFFGRNVAEYPQSSTPPVKKETLHQRIVPGKTTCTCHNDTIFSVGRLATWDNSWETHRSFYGAFEYLAGQ